MLRGTLLSFDRLNLRSPLSKAASVFRQVVQPSRYPSSSSSSSSRVMATKKKTATKQVGLGAWVKKGVNMADFTVPIAAAAADKETKPPTRAHTRKRNASSAAKTAAAEAKPKKPKKAGPSRDHEQLYWDQGKKWVCGVDEAGRGPLAGPVVAAACIFPEGLVIDAINDSKQMTEEEREEVYEELMGNPDVIKSVCVIDHSRIDTINILEATMEAMHKSVSSLRQEVDWVLIDGNRIPEPLKGKAEAIVKGDGKSVCIAAASVLAKVTRDRMMVAIAEEYPLYGFAEHKGYGTKAHMAAIHEHGPSPYHRMTFAPMKHMPGGSNYDGNDK